MSRMFRAFVTVAAGCAAALLSATQSLAVPAVPNGQTSLIEAPAGELCQFAVSIEVVSAAKERPGSTSDNLILTGPARITVTNTTADPDVSRTYNISGPTFIDTTTGPTGLVLTGPALILQPRSLHPEDDPFLITTSGRVTFTEDNTIDSIQGRITHDICAELS
jgi:hypothetical protein